MTQDASNQTMPLSFVNVGETVQLTEIRAGSRLRKRLNALGITVGMNVRVVQGASSGPMILAVANDSRLALGHGMAQKIMVTHIHEEHRESA